MNPSEEQLEQLSVLTPRPQQGAHLIGRGCVGGATNEVTWCCFCLEKSVHIPVFLIDKSEMRCFHTQWLRANQKITVVIVQTKSTILLRNYEIFHKLDFIRLVHMCVQTPTHPTVVTKHNSLPHILFSELALILHFTPPFRFLVLIKN